VIAELSQPGLQEEIDAAIAREAQSRADLQTLQGGGRSAETAELDASLNRLKSDRRRSTEDARIAPAPPAETGRHCF